MPQSMLLMGAGGVAVTAGLIWWLIRRVRRWCTTVRLRRGQAYHASLRA